MDKLSPAERSWNMSKIRSRNTDPEIRVRSALHSLGFRFRLHLSKLPGKPDIVLPKHKAVILVQGCFWHRHPKCKFAYVPKSRSEFWDAKFKKTIERDKEVIKQLTELGWKVITIWECETSNYIKLVAAISSQMTSGF